MQVNMVTGVTNVVDPDLPFEQTHHAKDDVLVIGTEKNVRRAVSAIEKDRKRRARKAAKKARKRG